MRWLAAVAVIVLGWGCAVAPNYGADGPRYAAGVPLASGRTPDTLRIVSYNIQFSYHVDSALVVLADPALRAADILLLQEMDAPSAQRIAEALRMSYVYYPATKHPRTGRDFGNAVLSRWPIVEDRKILLPHVAFIGLTRRIATAATVLVGETRIRVYSAHLGTVANISPAQRRDQVRTILADARSYDRVIFGGDMNDPTVGRVVREAGYAWPTMRGPRTASGARLDHIFLKGIASALVDGTGTVADNHHASDHLPVWTLGILR